MKHLILITCVLCYGFLYSQESETSNWLTNLEIAKEQSTAENKPILVYFTGSDWCSPCKKLKIDLFESEEFIKISQNLVLVEIDHPRRIDILSESQFAYNKEIIAQYNPGKSFPKMLMLNNKGKELGMITGYSFQRDTEKHFEFLNKHLTGYK